MPPMMPTLTAATESRSTGRAAETRPFAVAWATAKGLASAARPVLRDSVAAVSAGSIGGIPMLDLPYSEDVRADTDMNVVVTGSGRFVEVQGTAEQTPFDRTELDVLLDLAVSGIVVLTELQSAALAVGGRG